MGLQPVEFTVMVSGDEIRIVTRAELPRSGHIQEEWLIHGC